MVHCAQKAPSGRVVSRMLIMDLEMVPYVVSSMPKAMGNAMGRRTILYDACNHVQERSWHSDVLYCEGKPHAEAASTLLGLMSVMQARTLAVSMEVYSMCRNLGSLCCGQGGTHVQCWCWHWLMCTIVAGQ